MCARTSQKTDCVGVRVCALISCVQNVLCEAENPINADLLRNSKILFSRIHAVTIGRIFQAVSGSMYVYRAMCAVYRNVQTKVSSCRLQSI